MCEEMRRDENVLLLGEDVGVYRGAFGVTQEMYKEFPGRVIDTPISENGFVGCAIGMAVEGMRPIVEIMFSDFISVCFDMLLNQAPKMRFMFGGKVKVPMVLRTASGCGTGAAAQHSQSLEAMLCHIPGLKVVVPSTPYDAKGLLKTAIRDNNPVIFLEQKLLRRIHHPAWKSGYQTDRDRLHDRHVRAHGADLPPRGGDSCRGRHLGGSHRSEDAASDGQKHGSGVRKEDQAPGHRP